jgi:DNA-damage-inducible protein J
MTTRKKHKAKLLAMEAVAGDRDLMKALMKEALQEMLVKVPNATTRKAIAELEAGKGKKFADDLMADLHADDRPATRQAKDRRYRGSAR